ncbi:MAG: hypothetical protein BroJett006_27520 [Betaproteobacteria bacterium]|nr:MAG: hypothetical protein BroJett006_27520 [Betaproteobacteria bacterium]
MTTQDEPDPKPGAGEFQSLATPASMGYQAPAAPAHRQDMTDEEIEAAFAALWRKLERCE